MSRAPIMQTEPRWRIECWHQPCSTCCLASINIWVTGEAVMYLLPSNGIGSVPFALVHFGPNARTLAMLPAAGGVYRLSPESHYLTGLSLWRCRDFHRAGAFLRWPYMAEHGEQRQVVRALEQARQQQRPGEAGQHDQSARDQRAD